MLVKPLKYVEVTVDKGASKEVGLLLLYEEVGDVLRLVLDNVNSTAVFNLRLVTVTNIHISDFYKSTDRIFNASNGSQKLAKELLCEIIDALKKENKLNASGFVNIASYKDIPDKYTVKALTHVVTYPHVTNYTPVKPSIDFLATIPTYHNYNPPQKKIGVIFRKSELPTAKAMSSMLKKVKAVTSNVYKLKVKPLSEDDAEPEVKDDQEQFDMYGDYGDGYCGGIHGGMM